MGLLDDLKKQAELVKTQQISAQSLREESVRLVEEKMRQTFTYLNELLKQLAVVKPVNPLVFSLPGLADLKDLGFAESFIDYRRKRIGDKEYFDLISFFIKWGSGQTVTIDRDMPPAAQKVRDALFSYGLKFQEDEIRGQRGTAAYWRFTVQPSIVTDIVIRADHQLGGGLFITGKNLERLGVDAFAIPASEVNEALLEQFAKILLGQPGGFRKYRTVTPPPR
jgi:hypothetical protein